MDTSLRDRLIGHLLDGRYDVRGRIARGGMATVYRAVDRRLDRDVAVKVMHPHLSQDPDFVNRFIREARSAARLSHPNVVQVFDQGADGDEGDEVLYLAMELLTGRTLREVLTERGALTPREALTVTESVLDALGAAHRAGIVHRDIKPENVILTDEGRVKVADFGLARAMGSGPTQTGALMGTVAYLPPELVSRGTSDARGDVYASGIMLFEMLTGRQPFTGDIPVQVAYRHVHEDVPHPSSLVSELPTELDDLVAVAVARNPDERAADAATWLTTVRNVRATLLDEVLDYRPTPAPGPPSDPALEDDVDATTSLSRAGAPVGPSFAETTPVDPSFARQHAPSTAEPLVRVTNPTQAFPQLSDLRTLRERSRQEFDDDSFDLHDDSFDDDEEYEQDFEDAADDPRSAATANGGPPSQTRLTQGTGEFAELAKRRRRRGLLSLGILLGITILLSVIGWWQVAGPGRFVDTPVLTGQTESQARAVLDNAGLSLELGEPVYDETVPQGQIVSTDPAAGRRVEKNGTVSVIVSLGSEKRAVPKLVGRTLDEATSILTDNDLKLGRTTQEYSDTVASGLVISSSPGSGSPRKAGDSVAVTVSKGAEPVAVPDVQTWWQDDATNTLEDAGFVVEVRTEQSQEVDEDQVIRTEPAAGTQAPRGSTVVVFIAQNPSVQVPSLGGWDVDSARKALEDLGLQVQINKVAGGRTKFVVGQDPEAGSWVDRGSTVTLNVL